MSKRAKTMEPQEDESLAYIIGVGTAIPYTAVPDDDSPTSTRQIGFIRGKNNENDLQAHRIQPTRKKKNGGSAKKQAHKPKR